MSELTSLIESLPARLEADYKLNEAGFGGTTVDMDTASGNMVANLRAMWVELAEAAFKPNALGVTPQQWVDRFIAVQSELSGVLAEPDGPGTGGTIVGQEVSGDIIDELQRLISRTVAAFMRSDDNDAGFKVWDGRWMQSQPRN